MDDFAAGPAAGGVRVTDSAGVGFTADVSDAATVGEVLDLFNAAAADAGAGVRAELNDTGDGFRLTDTAAGSGELSVADSAAAAALRLGGTAPAGGSVSARDATVIQVEEGDTLADLAEKLNAEGTGVTAQIADDGTTLASSRLILTSTDAGAAGRFRLDDRGLAPATAGGAAGLGATASVRGEDALLAVGADAAKGFLLADSDGTFDGLPGGLGVTLKKAAGEPVTVTVGRDDSGVTGALKSFVASYNNLVGLAGELTGFDAETNERGVLQGNATVGRILRRVRGLLTRRFGPDGGGDGGAAGPRTLFDLGMREGKDGKLTLRNDRLDAALADDPAGVAAFFRDKTAGFAGAAQATLDTLNDPFDGLFELESDSLRLRQDRLGARVASLEKQLDVKRNRLVLQYAAMEETISRINASQSSLLSIQNLVAPANAR